jgi:lipopolysaccharide exporter
MPAPVENEISPYSRLAQRTVRGSLWVAIGAYFNIGFGFLATLALTRILAPEHFGAFSYASFMFGLINLRMRISVSQGFIQRKEVTPELIGTHLALGCALGAGGLLLAGIAAPIVRALGMRWDVVWLVMALAGLSLVDSFNSTAMQLLNRELHFGWTSLVQSIAFPLSYLPALWLALHGGGPWSLFAQHLAYILLMLPFMYWILRRQVPQLWQMRWRFDKAVARQLLHFGAQVGLASFASLCVGSFDNFLIGTFVNLETLGYYDRAYRLAQWQSLLVADVLAKTSIYAYARMQDDPVRLKKSVTMAFWLISTLGLPIAAGMFIAAPDLIVRLYGARWLSSVIYLRFLVVLAVVQPLMGDAGRLFIAIGKPRLSMIIAAVEAGVLIVIGTPLTLLFGAVGTCVAVALTFLVGLILTYRYIRRVMDIDLWEIWITPGLAALLVVSGYFLGIRPLTLNAWPVLGRLAFQGGYVLLSYFGLLMLLQPRGTTEKVQYVWRLLRRP